MVAAAKNFIAPIIDYYIEYSTSQDFIWILHKNIFLGY